VPEGVLVGSIGKERRWGGVLAVAANNGAGGGSDWAVGRLARRGRGGST
jgi:hypothetical protein